jgi:hypothetical protein
MPLMKRFILFALLVTGGCLDRGDPVLLAKDLRPPTIISSNPVADGALTPAGPIEVTFSKTMDPNSLVAGISLFRNNQEVPLTVTAPPPPNLPLAVIQTDQPYAITAQPVSGRLLPNAGYLLLLRKVLTDAWGNALADDVQIPFRTAL